MNDTKPAPDLRNIGFFGKLPPKRRQYLESKLKRINYRSGSQIIKQGRSGNFLGIVESGQIVLENSRGQSRALTTGEYIGTEMFRYGKPSVFSFSTQTEVSLWVLQRADWMAPSPPAQPRTINIGAPRLLKSHWISLIITLALAMVVFVLGPIFLEYTNNSLPDYFIETGRADLAEEYLRFIVRWQPESAKLHGDLGDLLVLVGKDQEAITAYQHAITLDEFLPWIHNNLGVLLLEQDQVDLAADHFQKALNLNPQNTDTYHNLGNAYYELGEWQAAAKAYQQALDLDSSLVDIKADRAGIILYQSQLDEAREAWEGVLLENPRQGLALQGLGVVALLEEDPVLAMLYLDAARYIDPQDLTTRLYIGLALESLNKPAEAATEYQFVLETTSDPELSSLADTLYQVVQE
ncbi:MAG: tetratricopeptide repeat protein [Anaerolineales bacterium]